MGVRLMIITSCNIWKFSKIERPFGQVQIEGILTSGVNPLL